MYQLQQAKVVYLIIPPTYLLTKLQIFITLAPYSVYNGIIRAIAQYFQ